jgi:two-component system, cell cycle sensor histidine kinase and response regulator CckA
MTPASIFVVEDEKIIAKGLESQLKDLGYSMAGTASSGEEAVRRSIALRPDLILMDINLGEGMDGIDAATAIRKEIDVPVVFLTAFSDEATIERAKRTNPDGYILKPYEDKDLQTVIEIGLYKHRSDRRLRENEQWLAATLGSIGDGVIATNESGQVRFMNPLAEQLTGWKQDKAMNRDVQSVFNIVDERTRQPVANPAIMALATGEVALLAPDTILIDQAGSERPIDDSAAPIRDVNGAVSGAVLVFRDITERRRLEDHLRQAQKMEAIGRLAGGIAHDFNNIMTIILGLSELLSSDQLPPAQRLEAARDIYDAGKRAADLTQQIMAFSRKQMLVPCVLNLNSVVRDMGMMVKRLIGSNIEFVVEVAPDLGQVRADPTQLGQVILNLAANARDAMKRGGRLVIRTANAELDAEAVTRHPGLKPGSYAVLSLSDTGVGIPPDVLAKIFEPFFTTKDVGEGTGLGLATVYSVVQQSGGQIEVSSGVGVGTTFRIYLPRIEEDLHPVGHHEASSTAEGSETILLVEDDDMVRKLTKTILQQSGYTVLEAANGEAALTVAAHYKERIDLLMTDIMMPHYSGREVADRLLPLKQGLRVLFMSGYTEDAILNQGVESTTSDFLHKPFRLDELKSKVRALLDRPTTLTA